MPCVAVACKTKRLSKTCSPGAAIVDPEARRRVERAVQTAVAAGVSSGAERQRTRRARRAQGHIVLRVEVDEVAVEELLIAEGYLAEWQTDHRGAVQAALGRLIAGLVTRDAIAGATER